MNNPKNQQEMPLVEETFLDQVTGSGAGQSTAQPSQGWNHPFDSPSEPPATERLIEFAPGVKPKHATNRMGRGLDHANLRAIQQPELFTENAKLLIEPTGPHFFPQGNANGQYHTTVHKA